MDAGDGSLGHGSPHAEAHRGVWRFHYAERRSEWVPPGWAPLSALPLDVPFDVSLRISELFNPLPHPPDWAQDLFRIAYVACIADQAAPRQRAPDRWTRTLHVSIPVAKPRQWHGRTELLEALLGFLTSDTWKLELRDGGKVQATHGRLHSHGSAHPSCVALFSGGLDSLAFAAERAQLRGGDLLLVGHHDAPVLAGNQARLVREIQSGAARQVTLKSFSANPFRTSGAGSGRAAHELPTRSLLLLAAGVLVSVAHGVSRLYVPENGLLAVNPPLTAGRLGACSTRSTHPQTLHLFNTLLSRLNTEVRAENPYALCTKGDVCRIAATAGITPEVLAETVSCGQPGHERSAQRYRNCGACHACLVRRAGLRVALGRDPTAYARDPFEPARLRDRPVAVSTIRTETRTVLALIRWLCSDFDFDELVRNSPLPSNGDAGELLSVVGRGRSELRDLLDDALPEDIQSALRWRPSPHPALPARAR